MEPTIDLEGSKGAVEVETVVLAAWIVETVMVVMPVMIVTIKVELVRIYGHGI